MPRITDENEVMSAGERGLRLAMHVVDELAGGIEDLQAGRSGALVKGGWDTMS